MDILSFAIVLVQILLIDLVLAGDNAIVIGLAVARLQPEQRRKAILVGVIGATVIRVAFAIIALQLLAIVGLMLAGGILLLWVVWKSARELYAQSKAGEEDQGNTAAPASLGSAIWKIVVADVSMSLDNVLAVAGAARDHPVLLAIGLIVSVGLMGVAASLVARLMQRYPWVAWIGIAIVFYVALHMIWEGWHQVAPHLS
ncbi:TerC family protein [Acidocella aminolytica]|jgi:YjbE family integral membrane protein|uniref:Integral membrane protein TerC n=1 Tax=Acidocella aminolytica 101 = DSM 11237 TaxID=1120923 RepID=A0A0D6PEP3_9PROT|nr:TerC family protein [Acidocella aminolytica]GAN79334.1 integral membrane protein TerC [Acidocella aminolytica 101 = DSM 11237]GBQ39499.1 integral membrane protein TerC [Acidocella aminolytica 101 = DSM 11237]SHE38590.1 integral membrane protein, YjbE family [Acidocella aminolytica 101 = DSM 11237]